jgi:hypothetical protein
MGLQGFFSGRSSGAEYDDKPEDSTPAVSTSSSDTDLTWVGVICLSPMTFAASYSIIESLYWKLWLAIPLLLLSLFLVWLTTRAEVRTYDGIFVPIIFRLLSWELILFAGFFTALFIGEWYRFVDIAWWIPLLAGGGLCVIALVLRVAGYGLFAHSR